MKAAHLLAVAFALSFALPPALHAAPGDVDALNLNLGGTSGSIVNTTAMQPDGKLIIGGTFTSVLGVSRLGIARLNADGTLDMGFDPKANGGPVYQVCVQADGRVLLGGGFTSLQPNGAATATVRNMIARVNADGTLDAGFDPKADAGVPSVALQADGKVLLGGFFTTLQPNGAVTPIARQYIARVNADGTLDTDFDPKPDNALFIVAVQADERVLLGGLFSTLQPNGALTATPRHNIARVNADGTLDMGFDPKANNNVYSVAVQADGRVLLGGQFTTLQPNGAATATARNFFARLLNDPATQTLTTPNATQALWTRGGAGPELRAVTFELSTNGGTSWTALGAGTRVGTTANWQRTGLTLSGSGQLRAQGRTTDGDGSGSSSLIEQVAAFSILTPIQQWKLTRLGDANAPDLGDPDFDGLRTLAEYGLNLLPETPSQSPGVSVFTYVEGDRLRMFVPRDPTHNDITVSVEATGDLVSGPWTPLATSTLGTPFTGPGYVGGDDATPGIKTVEVRDTVNISSSTHRWVRVKVSH
ncbi:MAG: delta-60 repeat domain-containing protein [Chthoniobacteraceae bacterium]